MKALGFKCLKLKCDEPLSSFAFTLHAFTLHFNFAVLRSYTEVAGKMRSPERIVGAHFFSPAHVMQLFEIIRTAHTPPQAREGGLPPVQSTFSALNSRRCGRCVYLYPFSSYIPRLYPSKVLSCKAEQTWKRGASERPCPRVLVDTLGLSKQIKKTPVVVGNCTAGLHTSPHHFLVIPRWSTFSAERSTKATVVSHL